MNREKQREQARQRVLQTLRTAGRGLSISDLAKQSGFPVNALTSMVGKLQSRGDIYTVSSRFKRRNGGSRPCLVVEPVVNLRPDVALEDMPAWLMPRVNNPLEVSNERI